MPEIKAEYESIDSVPETYKDLYTEQDGRAVLNVPGLKTQSDFDKFEDAITKRLTETRERLTNTRTQLDAYGGLTPEQVKELQDKADANTGDKGGTKNLSENPEYLRALEDVTTYKGEVDALKTTIKKRDIRDGVLDKIMSSEGAKINPDALPDVITVAQAELEVTESGIFTREGLNGTKPHRNIDEWLEDQMTKRRYWFGTSTSGNADGGDGGGQNFSENYWTAEHWNVTKQGQVIREDAGKADRMAKAAGTTVNGLKPAAKK